MKRVYTSQERRHRRGHRLAAVVAVFFACVPPAPSAGGAQTHRVNPEMDQTRVQQVIDGARSGDSVVWTPGTYPIATPLVFRSGVTYAAEGTHDAVLDASATAAPVKIVLGNGSHNITFSRL